MTEAIPELFKGIANEIWEWMSETLEMSNRHNINPLRRRYTLVFMIRLAAALAARVT